VKLVIASAAIAIGVVLIAVGVINGVTGDEVTKLPAAIETINPRPDAVQVPSQTTIVIEFADGYTGRLTIDGVTYPTDDPDRVRRPDTGEEADDAPEPGDQVVIGAGSRFDRGNWTLKFTPGEEVGFDEFPPGNHSVTVEYWKLEDEVDQQPPESTRHYTWTFHIV